MSGDTSSDALVSFVEQHTRYLPDDRLEAADKIGHVDRVIIHESLRGLVEEARAAETEPDEAHAVLERILAVASTVDVCAGEVPFTLFDTVDVQSRRTRMLVGAIANAVETDYARLADKLRHGNASERRGAARYYSFCSQVGGGREFVEAQAAGIERVCGPLLALTDVDDVSVRREAVRTLRKRLLEGETHVPAQFFQGSDRILAALDDDDPTVREEATLAALSLVLVHERDDLPEGIGRRAIESLFTLRHTEAIDEYVGALCYQSKHDVFDWIPEDLTSEFCQYVVRRSGHVAGLAEATHYWILHESERMHTYVDSLANDLRSGDEAAVTEAADELNHLASAVRKTHVSLLTADESNYSFVLEPAVEPLKTQFDALSNRERERAETYLEVVDDHVGPST